jgi:hypothetical protein
VRARDAAQTRSQEAEAAAAGEPSATRTSDR